MSPEEEIETLHRELAAARHERDIARASARGACDDLMRQMARTDELLRERDAAIARAEKAEREIMTVQEWARVWSARVDLVEVEAARLREALRPFAEHGMAEYPGVVDGAQAYVHVSLLRAARAALAPAAEAKESTP